MIVARSPLRISFAGGGTDLPPFVDTYGGAVLNVTINRYAYCSVEHAIEYTSNVPEITEHCLYYIKSKYNKETTPVSILINSETDQGSGLGGSSAIVVSCLNALYKYFDVVVDKYQLANDALYVERKLCGFPGGKQDQFATVFGGFNYIRFLPSGENIVTPIHLDEDKKRKLLYSLILYNIGVSRTTNTVLDRNIEGLKSDTTMTENTKYLLANCEEARNNLMRCDIENIGKSFELNWKIKADLHSGITSNPFSEVKNSGMKNGAIGAKICGAGGGGHLLFVVDKNKRANLITNLRSLPGHIEYFDFSYAGSEVWDQ